MGMVSFTVWLWPHLGFLLVTVLQVLTATLPGHSWSRQAPGTSSSTPEAAAPFLGCLFGFFSERSPGCCSVVAILTPTVPARKGRLRVCFIPIPQGKKLRPHALVQYHTSNLTQPTSHSQNHTANLTQPIISHSQHHTANNITRPISHSKLVFE